MGRIFAIGLLVVAIWVGLEVYNEGVHGAFGGSLAFLAGEPEAPADAASTPQRVRQAVGSAHAEAAARREKLMGDQ